MSVLQDIGLTKNEEAAFKALIEYPESTAAFISRELQLDKSSTYRAIDGLVIKGLVIANVKKRGSTYKVDNPSVLKDYYDTEKALFDSKGKILDTFIEKIKKNSEEQRNTIISLEYTLDDHIKRMEDSLSTQDKLIRERFRNHSIFENKKYVDYVRKYVNERVKRGIHIRQLELDFGEMYKSFKEIMVEQEKYKKEVRLLPQELGDNNSFRIWDDTVHIISYDKSDKFIVITIKDTYVAELMKNMYDLIWNMSKPVTSNLKV